MCGYNGLNQRPWGIDLQHHILLIGILIGERCMVFHHLTGLCGGYDIFHGSIYLICGNPQLFTDCADIIFNVM